MVVILDPGVWIQRIAYLMIHICILLLNDYDKKHSQADYSDFRMKVLIDDLTTADSCWTLFHS